MTAAETILYLTIITGTVWAVTVIALYIGLGRHKAFSGDFKPRLSVLIAIRNEEKNIDGCLLALSTQDYPLELREIVVIDDNSTDRTKEIASGYTERIPGFKVIDAGTPREGVAPKKSALITGIAETTGEIIITTDADCSPPTGWLSEMAGLFEPDVDAVVGFSPLEGRGIAGVLSRFDSLVNAVISAGALGLGVAGSAVGRNFAYRRQAWLNTGGFGSGAAAASGDDDLLLQRIAANGGKILFATNPATFVPASGKKSLVEWWRMKRRHFSAGKRYKPGLIFLGTLLYLFNPALIATTVCAICGEIKPYWINVFWGLKIGLDGLALEKGANLFRVQDWKYPWLIGELVSPFILTVLLPASMVGKISWKGRSLKT